MRRFLLILLFVITLAFPLRAEPWPEGEKLVYRVRWGLIEAAEGTFTAKSKGNAWSFSLLLKSLGPVEMVYPMRDCFWSVQQKSPWRSIEYGEDRYEADKHLWEKTLIDYKEKKGVRQIWNKGETRDFSFTSDALDDLGSMLYGMRRVSWTEDTKQELWVYEGDSVKTGEASCIFRGVDQIGDWPKQKVVEIYAEPVSATTHKKKGKLWMWLTDDNRRLPLRARVQFKLGTFEINLISATPAPGASR